MIVRELMINEDLGNLNQLNAGPLINMLKQSIGVANGRRGPDPYSIKADTKFSSQTNYLNIGPNSEIVDCGVLKSGIKTLRAVYKKYAQAAYAAAQPRGFAIYINNQIVIFGIFDAYDLSGATRSGAVAFDFRKFADEYKKLNPTYDQDTQTDISRYTSVYSQKPHKYSYEKPSPDDDKLQHYFGVASTTSSLAKMIEDASNIAAELKLPITFKLLLSDPEITKLRDKRTTYKQLQQAGDDLKTRLTKFKLRKKPTVDTIEEFLGWVFKNPGKIIQFDGKSYKAKLVDTYSKLDPMTILNGTSFEVRYNCVDPGSAYDYVSVTYAFNKYTNMLLPIEASWDSKSDGKHVSQKAVIDAAGYINNKFKVTGDNITKQTVIPKLLGIFKNGKSYYPEIIRSITALKKLGYDWEEFNTIINSINFEIQKDKQG